MLSEQEKRDFLLSTIPRMANHTFPFLTQVVGVVDDRTGEHRGNGVFCKIGGRQAIVTARHVIDEAAESGRFQSIAFTRGSGEKPAVAPGIIVSSEEFDLAVYLPDRDFPIGESKRFWPEEGIKGDLSILPRDYLFVQGFPGRFSRFTTLGANALASESLAYGAMMRLTEDDIPAGDRDRFVLENPDDPLLPSGSLKPHQFALNFSTDPTSFLDPEGHRVHRPSHIEDWSELFRPAGDHETLPGQKQRVHSG